MRIAFIAIHDGYNLAIANLIRVLIKRKHCVHVFAYLNTEHHLQIFRDYNIPLHDLKQITSSVLDTYDSVFAPNEFLRNFNFLNIKKYVFSINDNVFHDPSAGADFIFSNGEKWKEFAPYPFEKNCILMETGCLKINSSISTECDKYDDEHTILFIDSGHMPYGTNGKSELAKLLLCICKKYTDYRIIIKPRILPGSKHATHRNENHLYDNIREICNGKIPSNLIMLMDHLQLGKLIQNCKVVLCLFTTAYLEAVLYDKNIIIIDDLPNEDNFNARIATFFNPTREVLRSSGCLVSYKDVINYLPNGIKCLESHIKEQIYYKGYVAEIIADILEYIHSKYICKGVFPNIATYQCFDYKNTMQIDETLDYNVLIKYRIKNCLRHDVGIIKKNLNCKDIKFEDEIDYIIKSLDDESYFYDFSITKYYAILNKIIKIFLYHQNDFSNDNITQTFLLYCKLALNQVKEVAESKNNGCMSISLYAQGLICLQNSQIEDSINYFELYLKIVENNSYDLTIADTLRQRAYVALIISYMAKDVKRDDLYNKINSEFMRKLPFAVMNGRLTPENAINIFFRSNKYDIIYPE